MTASVTRTVSVAVIALEINGHMNHAVPVFFGVITAYIISELINPQGFYEMMMQLRGFQAMLVKKGNILVRDALAYDERYTMFNFLHMEMDKPMISGVLARVLERENIPTDQIIQREDLFLPVVDNEQDMTLLYLVKVSSLQR